MSSSAALLEHIAQAEEHVCKAMQSWDASRPTQCAGCLHHLQQAIESIEQANRAAACGIVASEAKTRLQQLRREAEVLSKLVDAAMGFYRGLALHSGMDEAIPLRSDG